jgi:hypothetical protein
MKEGSAELSLACTGDWVQVANRSVQVEVKRAVGSILSLPARAVIAKGLQATLFFSYSSREEDREVQVISESPSTVLVSSSANESGSESIRIRPVSVNGPEYVLYLQGLKAEGTVRVRLRFPNREERAIEVEAADAGAGFHYQQSLGIQGFDRRIAIVLWALDRSSGLGIQLQRPSPGASVQVRLRSEGAPVRLSTDSVTLTVKDPQAELLFTLPAAGQSATLIADPPAGFTSTQPVSRVEISGPVVSGEPVWLRSYLLSRYEMMTYTVGSSYPSGLIATSSDPARVLLSSAPGDSPAASVSTRAGSALYIHGLEAAGSASVRLDAPGIRAESLEIGLKPLDVAVTGPSIAVGAEADYTMALSARSLTPGFGPFRFSIRSINPAVATVKPETVELSSTVTSAKLRVSGISAGVTQLSVEGPGDVFTVPDRIQLSVASAASNPSSYTIGNGLQTSVQIDLGSSFQNPSGTILTLTSSDSAKLRISRAASVLGAESVSVAVPAGDRRTQAVYLQALAEGQAEIRATVAGTPQTVASVRIVPSWYNCGTRAVKLSAGESMDSSCNPQLSSPSQPGVAVTVRPGLENIEVRLSSSAPEVFTVTPEVLTLGGSNRITLRGIAPGNAELRVTPQGGLGKPSDGSDALPVSVVQPVLPMDCKAELVMGKDLQRVCSLTLPSGVKVTAVSEQPHLLVVSSDKNTPGQAQATATSSLVMQALASSGTAEVVLQAPGYQETRIAVALRPSIVQLKRSWYNTGAISLQVGGEEALTVSLMPPDGSYSAVPRAGIEVPVDVTLEPAGVVTVDKNRFVLTAAKPEATLTVRGAGAGSALIRITAPQGGTVSGSPMPVTVRP